MSVFLSLSRVCVEEVCKTKKKVINPNHQPNEKLVYKKQPFILNIQTFNHLISIWCVCFLTVFIFSSFESSTPHKSFVVRSFSVHFDHHFLIISFSLFRSSNRHDNNFLFVLFGKFKVFCVCHLSLCVFGFVKIKLKF